MARGMIKWVAGVVAVALGAVVAVHDGAPVGAEEARSGPRVLKAATALLEALDAQQREAATFPLGGAQHEDWHFIPRARKGVSFKAMTTVQRERLRALLGAALGEYGVEKTEQVRRLEGILARIEGEQRRFPRDPELYSLSFFGKPAAAGRWGWRFEGHHLSINFELVGDRVVSCTPAFFGSNPAIVPSGPHKGLEVLRDVEVKARELVGSLSAEQLARCRGEEVPNEVPATGKSRYDGPFPAGIAGAELDEQQLEVLGALLMAYGAKLAPDLRQRAREELVARGGLAAVRFAWRGELETGKPHSYLVHSPSFVINFSNVQNGANHVHSSVRVRDGDFGKSLAKPAAR